jgi:hypothetical protein
MICSKQAEECGHGQDCSKGAFQVFRILFFCLKCFWKLKKKIHTMRCQAKGVFAEAFELGGEKTEVQIALQEWKEAAPECMTQNKPAECRQNLASSSRQDELSADIAMPARKQQQQLDLQQECGQKEVQGLDDGHSGALRDIRWAK